MNCITIYNYIEVINRIPPAREQDHRDVLKGIQYSIVAAYAFRTGHNIECANIKILASESKEITLIHVTFSQ